MKPSAKERLSICPERYTEHTTMRTKRIAAQLFTALALLMPMRALAADPVKAKGPSVEYERGYAAIEAKNWTKAYEIFSELWAHPKGSDSESDVAISLGQAELKVGKYRDAAEHLSIGILMTPPDELDTKERAGKGLAFAKKKIGTLMIVAPDGTEIAVNGKTIGTAPIVTEVFVDPGTAKITGKHPTKGKGESQFEVKAADERKVELQLQLDPTSTTSAPLTPPYTSSALDGPKTKANAPIQITPPPPVEKKSGIETKTIVLIAGGVVTLAAAGTATYFGLRARAAGKDAEDLAAPLQAKYGQSACTATSGADADGCAEIARMSDDRRDAARFANISLAVGGVAIVATTLTYLLWPRTKTQPSGFIMIPSVQAHGGGLNLQGSF